MPAKKVFLIYPPTQLINREDRCQVPTKDVVIAPALPPMDLLYLAAVAEANGAECKVVDYSIGAHRTEEFCRTLRQYRPDLLVVSVTTPTLSDDLTIIRLAKQELPSVCTVAKAAHFLEFSKSVLAHCPDLDIIIRGEPEETFAQIVQGLPLTQIEGITYRVQGVPQDNPDRGFIQNLDSLPFPARHLIDNRRYCRPDNGRPQAIIKVSRGCPFHCFFCLATPVSGPRVRMRSPGNILQEVALCIRKWGIHDFLFWSDIFDYDKSWVMRLCAAINDSGLRFRWAANSRPDTIDLEMAQAMRRAGCTLVSVGVESGNEQILERIGKKTTIAQIKKAFAVFKQAGLKTFAYYIIGFPWDTPQTIEETIGLALTLDSDFANFFTATAFPGTRFFRYAKEEGLLEKDDWSSPRYRNAYYEPTVGGHYLTQEQIVRFHREAVRRFYFRPRYLLKALAGLRSPRELYCYAKASLALLRRQGRGR